MEGIVYCCTVVEHTMYKQDHNKVLLISVACLKERELFFYAFGDTVKKHGLIYHYQEESFVKTLDFSFQWQ